MTGGPEDDMRRGPILVLNAGSSSIKFAVFTTALEERISGFAAEIGTGGMIEVGGVRRNMPLPDHRAALGAVLSALDASGIELSGLSAAAHRVVHGGTRLDMPVRITPKIEKEIAACSPLAPLHNPHNLAAIRLLGELSPDLAQYASFDTSFHATNPDVATRYAIPRIEETKGIRRYGFHGISYAGLVQALPGISGGPLPGRLLAFHLGNGASVCAIRDGRSIATTMGYSPLDGLTMGTRSGGIDANAVLRLVEDHGLVRTREILNHESGLLGLSGGKSDMRKLMLDPSAESAFAVEHFCYWTVRHSGSLIAAMQGLDAIAFTGGIGENAHLVRARILDGLRWLGVKIDEDANRKGSPRLHEEGSVISAWIVPAEEERMIARDALHLMEGGH